MAKGSFKDQRSSLQVKALQSSHTNHDHDKSTLIVQAARSEFQNDMQTKMNTNTHTHTHTHTHTQRERERERER